MPQDRDRALRPAGDREYRAVLGRGDVLITEGPLVQTMEYLAGWFIAERKDQAEPIQPAVTIPGAWYGAIEVKAAQEM